MEEGEGKTSGGRKDGRMWRRKRREDENVNIKGQLLGACGERERGGAGGERGRRREGDRESSCRF